MPKSVNFVSAYFMDVHRARMRMRAPVVWIWIDIERKKGKMITQMMTSLLMLKLGEIKIEMSIKPQMRARVECV